MNQRIPASRKGIPKRWVASRHLARTGREPWGPGQRPGIESDVRSASSLCPSPSVARVCPSRWCQGRPAGRAAAALDSIGYDFRPDRRRVRSSCDAAISTSLRSSIPRNDIEATSRKQAIDNKYTRQGQTQNTLISLKQMASDLLTTSETPVIGRTRAATFAARSTTRPTTASEPRSVAAA